MDFGSFSSFVQCSNDFTVPERARLEGLVPSRLLFPFVPTLPNNHRDVAMQDDIESIYSLLLLAALHYKILLKHLYFQKSVGSFLNHHFKGSFACIRIVGLDPRICCLE